MQKTARCRVIFYFIVIIAIGISSCVPRVTVPPVSKQIAEDEFITAEQLFEKGDYQNALERYLAYLNQYPKAPMASTALMKIASIYAEREDYESARTRYERLIRDFPTSMFLNDARVEVLNMLLKQENYPEILVRSKQIPIEELTRIQKIRMAMMVGDAYMATGVFVDATEMFISAYGSATPIEQTIISEKIKDAFVGLTENDIQTLIERLEKPEDIRIVMALKELTSFNREIIGCLLPLTGPYESIGKRAARGMELAYHEWISNTQKPFRIIIKDTASDRDTTILSVQELLDEKVACILGPIITADLAANMAQERRVPIITLTQKEDITQTGEYVFRNFITPKMQVKALLQYAMEQRGAKKFAILYPKEKYGTTFMNDFWDEIIQKNGEVVGAEAYDLEETDFSDPVKKLVGLYYTIPQDLKIDVVEQYNVDKVIEKNMEYIFAERFLMVSAYMDWTDYVSTTFSDVFESNRSKKEELNPIVDFDALFIPDSPEKISMIVPQLPYYDVNHVMLLGPNIWHSNDLIELARNYVQGAVLTEGFFDESKSPGVQDFISRFEGIYNEKPGFIEAISYDTAMLIFNILASEDFQLRSDIQKALINLSPYEGVTGLTTFDDTGEANKKLFLLEVKGRQFLELNPQNTQ